MGTRNSNRTCEGCGKSNSRSLSTVAYRPLGALRGPFVLERLCEECKSVFLPRDIWDVRRTHPMQQMSLPGFRVHRA